MKITIQGHDYTPALDAARPLTIDRTLNEPSVCQVWLSLPFDGSLAAPARNQSLAIAGDDGTCYFTGYIAATPMPEYAGVGLEGPRYRLAIQALSDELLLDQLAVAPSKGSTGETAGALDDFIGRSHRFRCPLHAGAYAVGSGRKFCTRPGRNMEQECRATGESGSSVVSSDQWNIDSFTGASHTPRAQ